MVKCTASSSKSLNVEIKPPEEGSFDYYEILPVSSKDGVTYERVKIGTVHETITRALTNLDPYTNYTIRVKCGMTFMLLHSQEKSDICRTLEGSKWKLFLKIWIVVQFTLIAYCRQALLDFNSLC